MHDTYVYKDSYGNEAGKITIYRHNLNIGKITSLKSKEQEFKMLLKTEQFATLDDLLDSALDKIVNYLRATNDGTERLKLQNKYDGLNNLKKKIKVAKKEYDNNMHNQLAFNKLLNLYNSLKNLL